MDPLFPELPEDLSALSDEELDDLERQHTAAAEMIDAEDADYTEGYTAEEILEAYEAGVAQIEAIHAERSSREDAKAEYQRRKDELKARRTGEELSDEAEESAEGEEAAEGEESEEAKEGEELAEETEEEEAASEDDAEAEEKDEEEPAAEVAAAAPKPRRAVQRYRRPPAPSEERRREAASQGAVLVAAAGNQGVRAGQEMDRQSYAEAFRTTAQRRGRPSKSHAGVEEKILIASAAYQFPEDRTLTGHAESDVEKLRAALPAYMDGAVGNQALVASGGLCAPLTPIYTMPNFATTARPVRDALPGFNADRGGVNVPTATTIGDITEAITVIDEAEDALGGTFATKSCQDLDCPAYTETAITIISHCREYGNLVAMTWPEKIAHENDLTMAAHARVAETYLLDRIKALSVNVTNGAETLGAYIYLVDAIVKAKFGIQTRLRMDPNARFRALLPYWLVDLLKLDNIQTNDGNRFASEGELVSYLRGFGIEPAWYLDSPSTGTSQIADATQAAAAIDALPDNIQWALFPEGAFIHLDGGSLELGLVRDSTLNSTNDFQMFGEVFENVARLAPAQAAYWITSDLCANGMLAPAGTARTCD
jgi:hypothetical protein